MQRFYPSHPSQLARRGGAVIIVVLALLSLMLFLGVFFFEFAKEEQQSAEYFTQFGADAVVNPEPFFDEALQQLIVGPQPSRTQSVLWNEDYVDSSNPSGPVAASVKHGNVHSMLAHVLGPVQSGVGSPRFKYGRPLDVIPHNGRGIKPLFIDTSLPADGVPDVVRFELSRIDETVGAFGVPSTSTYVSSYLTLDPYNDTGVPGFAVNFSPMAQRNKSRDAFNQDVPSMGNPDFRVQRFEPDTDYTAADINHLYLAHEEIVNGRRVLIPSFFRPTMFPSRRDTDGDVSNNGLGAIDFSTLYSTPNAPRLSSDPLEPNDSSRLVMRPHKAHAYPPTASYPQGVPRYLTDPSTNAQSGDTSRTIGPFPFANDQDGDNVTNEMGVFSTLSTATNAKLSIPECNNYELDVDTDGDGYADAIWLDLGLDLVELPDGRQYVPMVAFKVLDADSLGNVNVHGNLQGMIVGGDNFSSGNSLSVSNMGLSPSEINLARLFSGNPAELKNSPRDLYRAQFEYAQQFGFANSTVTDARSSLEMANMDLIGLLSGRVSSVGTPLPGRHGEESLLMSSNFPATATQHPRAGVTGSDDDFDNSNSSATYDSGRSRAEIIYEKGDSTQVNVPPFVHPIALSGEGSDVVTSSGIEQRFLPTAPIASNPSTWPDYTQYYNDPGAPAAGVTPYSYSGVPSLMGQSSTPYGLVDEENEVIASFNQRDRLNDSLFSPSESIFLHVSDTDYQRANVRSRLDQLLPFNFRSARNSAQIRRRFTTDSWDLNELSYVNYRAGEYSQWDPSDDYPSDAYYSGDFYFPPLFGSLTLYDPPNSGTVNPLDPLRPEIRRLLASEVSSNTNNIGENRASLRQRLNLNRLLVGFDNAGNPIYRNLMPHPDFVKLENDDVGSTMPPITIPAMIHDHNTAAALPLSNIQLSPTTDADRATSAAAQEWWARYDRQRMARDIYTLLYLTGAKNSDSPATTAYTTTAYPNRQPAAGTVNSIPDNVEEMAQFAVNYVDAIDRDDVITTFEYDSDLSDGWSSNPVNRVYGVERQSLTFSEVMLIQLDKGSMADSSTLFKEDTTNTHRLLHIELRNALPFTVNVDEGWRIVRVPVKDDGSGNWHSTATMDKWYSFKTDGFGLGVAANAKSVGPGENFHIACHDGTLMNEAGTVLETSDLYADIDADSMLESVLPKSTRELTSNTVPAAQYLPQADIDLAAIGPGQLHEPFVHAGPTTVGYPVGTLVDRVVGVATNTKFDLVLQRRQNLRGIASAPGSDVAGESTGRWIEVDRFSIDSLTMGSEGRFAPGGDAATDIQAALLTLHSRERPQPFVPNQSSNSGTLYQNHSISATLTDKHGANSCLTGTTQFTIWQPHFDRDLTSVYDLLSIPIFGNFPMGDVESPVAMGTPTPAPAPIKGDIYNDYDNTYYPDVHGGAVVNLARGDTSVAGGATLSGDYTAGVRFLFPDGQPAKPYFGWNPVSYANDWHRLFEFVQVPRRTEQAIQSQYPNTVAGAIKALRRTPGLINLNTIRDETILAALLDDNLHTPLGAALPTTDPLSPGTLGRNWYRELRVSRDGVDKFLQSAGLYDQITSLNDPALIDSSMHLPSVTIPGTLSPAAPTADGVPTSAIPVRVPEPFRSASHIDPAATATVDTAIESTLMRSRPTNPRPVGSGPYSPTQMTTVAPGNPVWTSPSQTTTAWQALFDARDSSNHQIDYHTRNRLLAKVANNSTTKSHVFLIWTAVGYFEAHKTNSGYVQIGARMTDLPIHRSFGVVDMTRLEDAYDSFSQTFDYSKFVIARKRLR